MAFAFLAVVESDIYIFFTPVIPMKSRTKNSYRVPYGILACLCLTVLCWIPTVKCDNAEDNDDSAFRTEAATLLKSQIESFQSDRFSPGILLHQKVDRTNNQTYYIQLSNNKTLYERDGDDSNAMSVVLSASEDKLHFLRKKRSFIVLRRKEEQTGLYHPNFALIR
jgi:hypothetical protein